MPFSPLSLSLILTYNFAPCRLHNESRCLRGSVASRISHILAVLCEKQLPTLRRLRLLAALTFRVRQAGYFLPPPYQGSALQYVLIFFIVTFDPSPFVAELIDPFHSLRRHILRSPCSLFVQVASIRLSGRTNGLIICRIITISE